MTTTKLLAAAILASVLALPLAGPALAGPAFLKDLSPNAPDPHSILWEPKQAAYERLAAALRAEPRGPQDNYDARYYDIALTVVPSNETISGTATMRAASLVDGFSLVVLDLYDNLTVTSVTSSPGGTPLSYTHSADRLNVTLASPVNAGQEFGVKVTYNGHPVGDSFYFDTHAGQPIISSLSEPSGAREWWPCKDLPSDKADSVRIALTVPQTLVAASEGTLVSTVNNGNGTKTYTWRERHPITTYLVSVAISNYSIFSDVYNPGGGVTMPVTHYVYPEDLSDAQADFTITVPAIEFYASIYGEYPFLNEKYGMAEFPWGGAMEHQTLTSYGAVLIRGDHYYDWILVHELSHQWWGDWVTCRTWEDIWLNEGFASYSEALWFEHLGGFEDYKDYMAYMDYYGYFNGPIYDPWELFGRTVYKKGAWVLHMLRHVLGDREDLLDVLALYGAEHAYGTAITSEFQAAAEEIYGGSLDWFFQEWVYGMNRPRYEYAWVASDAGDHWDLMLHVDQVQTDCGVYTMPIDIVVETARGETTFVVWNNAWSQDFFLAVPDQPTALYFDPDNWILKHVQPGTDVPESGTAALALFPAPNPFTERAGIAFEIPAAGHATLAVYDVAGRLVRTLVDAELPAGRHTASWDGTEASGRRAAAGVYFCRLASGGGTASQKILRTK